MHEHVIDEISAFFDRTQHIHDQQEVYDYLKMVPAMLRGNLRRRVLCAVVERMIKLPKNDKLWAWTIGSEHGDYMTRALFPRLGTMRFMLHNIHRPDADAQLHNHPWAWGLSLIVAGGYLEQRRQPDGSSRLMSYGPGDINDLRPTDFHRVAHVMPGTWTLFAAGPRAQEWGFLDGETFTPWREHIAKRGMTFEGVRS